MVLPKAHVQQNMTIGKRFSLTKQKLFSQNIKFYDDDADKDELIIERRKCGNS